MITGANAGIGRSIAMALAEQGANLIVHHLNGAATASEVVEAARERGVSAVAWEGDLTKRETAPALADFALGVGPIDILILNAAVERRQEWLDVSDEDIDFHFNANFRSSLHLAQRLVPPMAERGWGRVIGIGSIMQRRAVSRALLYSSLKAAQQRMLFSIGHATARSGVTVNTVSPGSVITDRSAVFFSDPARRSAAEARIPAGRAARPDDCAGPVLMLCSDQGAYITGTDIAVDGGWSNGDAEPPASPR